jgi:hypothetical protein
VAPYVANVSPIATSAGRSPPRRDRAPADIAVAADDGELARQHHVGGELDAVDEVLAAAVELSNFDLVTLSLTLIAGAFNKPSPIIA